MPDRYEFRLTPTDLRPEARRFELQYLDPVSGEWRRLMRGPLAEVRETFESQWRDIRYSDDAETTGTFKAFS